MTEENEAVLLSNSISTAKGLSRIEGILGNGTGLCADVRNLTGRVDDHGDRLLEVEGAKAGKVRRRISTREWIIVTLATLALVVPPLLEKVWR